MKPAEKLSCELWNMQTEGNKRMLVGKPGNVWIDILREECDRLGFFGRIRGEESVESNVEFILDGVHNPSGISNVSIDLY